MRTNYAAAVKYAKALLALARDRHESEKILDDLTMLSVLFEQQDAKQVLIHPILPIKKKRQIIAAIVNAGTSPKVVALLDLLIEKNRGVLLPDIVRAYQVSYREKYAQMEVHVTSAKPLSEAQMDQLKLKLEMFTGKDIAMQISIDQQLKAGAKVQLGDLVLDGTLSGRLEQLKKCMRLGN